MPSTDRKLELKAKPSVAQTASQAAVCAKGLTSSAEPKWSNVDILNIWFTFENAFRWSFFHQASNY
jgi:hypothetical protein